MTEPAFPHDEKSDDGTHWHTHSGMSLRDWFAGQFLAGAVGDMGDDPLDVPTSAGQDVVEAALRATWADIAHAAYIAADAMLAERARSLTDKLKG